MFGRKANKEHKDFSDVRDINNDIENIYKEIRRIGKEERNDLILDCLKRIDTSINYKSQVYRDATPEMIDDIYHLSEIIKEAMIDAKELATKGTNYGVQLSLSRVEGMIEDRKIAKSPFLVDAYLEFEAGVWKITKLREVAYGQIVRLREKQDNITRTALMEKDSMMRVRFFEDIRVLEKDILRLENEAHQYDTVAATLHDDGVLKGYLEQYATSDKEKIQLHDFQDAILKLENKGEK